MKKDKLVRNKKRIIARRIQSLISPILIGKKVYDRKKGGMSPVFCNTKQDIIRAQNHHDIWLETLSQKKIYEHQAGEETYYFTGASRLADRETLVMIDIDCHKSGTLEGAMAFVKYLKNNYYSDLYYEVSTNGNGVHAYIIVTKFGVGGGGDEGVNMGIERLQKWLRTMTDGFDIELVEVKGKCSVWHYYDNKLVSIESGTLAKIPRGDFTNTTKLDHTDLLKIKLPEDPVKKVTEDPVKKVTVARTNKTPIMGSVSSKAITESHLATLPHLRTVAAEILKSAKTPVTKSRAVVTNEDVAIFLLIGQFFTNDMNKNGTMPKRRFEAFWTALYKAGDIDRGFASHRWTAIRNLLSDQGLLDWEDHTYAVQHACEWKFGEDLMAVLHDNEKKVEVEVEVEEEVEEEEQPLGKHFSTVEYILHDNEKREEEQPLGKHFSTVEDISFALKKISNPNAPIIRPVMVSLSHKEGYEYRLWTPERLTETITEVIAA